MKINIKVFPTGPPMGTSKEKRKLDMDAAIMATVLLDLQPINQVNMYI